MTTEANAIADLARKAAGVPEVVKTESGRTFLVAPHDVTVKDVTEPNTLDVAKPKHITQAVTLQTADSLVEYVNRFKTADTVLFADISRNSIQAAIDYHGPTSAALVAHSSHLTLPFAAEWTTWVGIDKKLMPQLEFARFLEENAADIVAPSGADLLEACRDLQAVRKVNFKKAVRTATDTENFEYSDETEARTTGGVELPTKFQLGVPVYFGGEPVTLYAFLRWSLDEGALKLGVALHRAEHVRQETFKKIVLDAAKSTERPAVFGRLGV